MPSPEPPVDPIDRPLPAIVVVGAASRDLAPRDARGWRLGGAVSYGSLTTARLGVETAALIGTDRAAAEADELDDLRSAGVDVATVELEHGPIFDNVETDAGRRQIAHAGADALPPDAVPAAWRGAPAWMFGPVAGELAETWAVVPSDEALVALGWQGLLRTVVAGQPVRRIPPRASSMLSRADFVGVSRDDLDDGIELTDLCRLLRPGATLLVTGGSDGGLVVEAGPDGPRRLHRYPAFRPDRVLDPTGAGDVFLAAVLAARVRPQLIGGRIGQRFDLRLAAAIASLVVEAPGLDGVPTRDAIRRRMAESPARTTATT